MADDQRPSTDTSPTTIGPVRFTPEEFCLLIESGVADKFGRLELRGGEIYRMNAQYALHARMRFKLARLLDDIFAAQGGGISVLDEVTVRFGDFMPLPDIVAFTGAVPRAPLSGNAVKLIVEVADTTMADDIGAKRDLYAAGGLAEYWVVDVTARTIFQHARPAGGTFTESKTVLRGQVAESLTLVGVRVDTAKLPWDVG